MPWSKVPEVKPDAVQRALYGEELPALDDFLACATRHGEVDDPDHEVGDLQDLARALWEALPEKKRAQAIRPWLETMRDTLDCTDPEVAGEGGGGEDDERTEEQRRQDRSGESL